MTIKESTTTMYNQLAPVANLFQNREINGKTISIFKKGGEEKYTVCILNGDNSLISPIFDTVIECETWITSNS